MGTLGNILWNLVNDWVMLVISFILFVQNVVKLFCCVDVKIKPFDYSMLYCVVCTNSTVFTTWKVDFIDF